MATTQKPAVSAEILSPRSLPATAVGSVRLVWVTFRTRLPMARLDS